MLYSDVPNTTNRWTQPKMERWDALVALRSQLMAWSMNGLGDNQVIISKKPKVSTKFVELMRRAADRVFKYSEEHDDAVYPWYVPESDILLEGGDDIMPFADGMTGRLYKGSWVNEWQQKPVIIKHYHDSGALNDNAEFSSALATWYKLHHENILEMLGANHIAYTKFSILESATEGNFWDFFDRDDENKNLLWDLSKQATAGLQFLHDNHVEHGNLSMTKILISEAGNGDTAKFAAKVSDFGMAFVRSEMPGRGWSMRMEVDRLRWVAPERLISSDSIVFRPRADTYSLGLCIWAAATGELPYSADDDDEAIVQKKLEHVCIERPDGAFTDDEWALVSRMLDSKPENRPTLEDEIKRMGELDVIRQQAWPFDEKTTRASTMCFTDE